MKAALDKERFGPWALVTGASSGIGKEFARQIAAAGINVVLVARREGLLAELGRAISQEFDVQYRALAMDLSQEGFIAGLADATHDLDIGLVVSNAGTGNPGEFLKHDRQLLKETLRLNTMSHLDIAHHFGARLTKRRRGGLILVGAIGAGKGLPTSPLPQTHGRGPQNEQATNPRRVNHGKTDLSRWRPKPTWDGSMRLAKAQSPEELNKNGVLVKIILIGANGKIGELVQKALEGAGHEIVKVGHKSGDFKVEIENHESVRKLYQAIGSFDAVAIAAGQVAFTPLSELTAEKWQFSFGNQLMGHINLGS